ncbi:MAG: V-type ATP synthase subunit F, partial [Candidatus Heimdallarchaeaceae archaeon]
SEAREILKKKIAEARDSKKYEKLLTLADKDCTELLEKTQPMIAETAKKAFVIGARETVRGFQLIGVPGKEVTSSEEALKLLENILSEDYILVIISTSIAEDIEEKIHDYRKELLTPIVIVSDVNVKVDKDHNQKMFKSFLGF